VKTRRAIVLQAIFFLVQGMWLSECLPSQACALNPPSRVSETVFKELATAISTAVCIYREDLFGPAFQRELVERFGQANNGVRFDLANMSRDGITRYYPVQIGEKSFIIRIFPSAKQVSAPEARILFEIKIGNPPMTCQVLPGINSILEDCKIKPNISYSNSEVARSS
jgi:hypothetical protein